jgi:PAS domain S-box-containing protein
MQNPPIADQSLAWLLAAATDPVLIVDRGGAIALANPALEALFGYTQEQLQGLPVETLIPERFRHGHQALREGYSAEPRPRAMGAGAQLSGRHREGREFPVEVSLSPLRSPDGQTMVMATIHDISARKAAEQALQESEARMRAVFETAVDAIITIDENGMLERLNPAAERMFGYREAEVAGRNINMLMPEPHRSAHDGYLSHYRATGEKRIIGKGREVQGLRRDGSVFPMDLSVAEMTLGGKRMYTGLVRDITERKLAEQKSQQLLQALRQSQDELRRLGAHQERIKEEERKRIAQEIHDELGGLLTGIRAYVLVAQERAVAAGSTPEPLLADTADLVQSAIETVRRVITDLRPSVLDQLGVWAALEWYADQVALRAGLRCVCRIDAQAAALELDADRSTMLFRIVQEALTNVVRHAQATQATIAVSCEADTLRLTVSDNGKGIAADGLLSRESWGILGMHERSRSFGGQLAIMGGPDGTVLTLRLPLEESKNGA